MWATSMGATMSSRFRRFGLPDGTSCMGLIADAAAVTELPAGTRASGRDIHLMARDRAAELRQGGVVPGSCVVLQFGPTLAFFIALEAVWQCGATAVCLDPDATVHERNTIVDFTSATAVLSANDTEFLSGSTRHAVAADVALILFTSGTTGEPKGVMLSHAALKFRLRTNSEQIGPAALARTLVTLPIHFGHGLIGNALTPLAAGKEIFLAPLGLSLAQSLGALVDAHGISFLTSVPAFWPMVLRMPAPTQNTLKRVHVGSAPLTSPEGERIRQWTGCPVYNCYGMTETANWFSAGTAPSLGNPWDGEAVVEKRDGSRAAQGSGELIVRTAGLMTGYFNRPDLTDTVLKDGWYRTGDFGEIAGDGTIRVQGRVREQINRAGTKINPAEVDAVVKRHAAVADACTFAIPDALVGEAIVCAVVLRGDAVHGAPTPTDLSIHCRGFLRTHAVPTRWIFCDSLPADERGKRNRDMVRATVLGDGT